MTTTELSLLDEGFSTIVLGDVDNIVSPEMMVPLKSCARIEVVLGRCLDVVGWGGWSAELWAKLAEELILVVAGELFRATLVVEPTDLVSVESRRIVEIAVLVKEIELYVNPDDGTVATREGLIVEVGLIIVLEVRFETLEEGEDFEFVRRVVGVGTEAGTDLRVDVLRKELVALLRNVKLMS